MMQLLRQPLGFAVLRLQRLIQANSVYVLMRARVCADVCMYRLNLGAESMENSRSFLRIVFLFWATDWNRGK
jgi:hypothetical protein